MKVRGYIVKTVLIIAIPLVIIFGVVRLVATEPYLAFEYNKSNFPQDLLGFDSSMRIAHAADNLRFVTTNQTVDDLAGQTHSNSALYNMRELKHMTDVKNVYQSVIQTWQIAMVLSLFGGIVLYSQKERRFELAIALRWGGLLTISLLAVIGFAAIIAWHGWFNIFHRLFFEPGSWTFDLTDTLIRLFPEKFWYDTALTVAGLSVIIGALIYWTGIRLSRKYRLGDNTPPQPGSADKKSHLMPAESGQQEGILTRARYIPALSFSWLTPFFALFMRWGMRERGFNRQLVQQANIRPGMRVLDLGCGTGALALMIKRACPDAVVVALDGDEAVLDIARTRAQNEGLNITFDKGLAFHLPYPDNSFNRVLSSLVFHHLSTENKQLAMHEIYRVLRAGGELHIVDFGKPHNLYARLVSLVIRHLEEASGNIRGLLPEMIYNAGFSKVEKTGHYTTLFGGLTHFRAKVGKSVSRSA